MSIANGRTASFAGGINLPARYAGLSSLRLKDIAEAVFFDAPSTLSADNENQKAQQAQTHQSDTRESYGDPAFDLDHTGHQSTLVRLLKQNAPVEKIVAHINMHFTSQREAGRSPTIDPGVLDEAVALVAQSDPWAVFNVLDRQAAIEYAIRQDEELLKRLRFLEELEERRRQEMEELDAKMHQARAPGFRFSGRDVA